MANALNADNINANKILTVGSMTTDTQNSILNSNIQIGGRNLALATEEWSATRSNTNNGYMAEGIGIFKTTEYGSALLTDTSITDYTVSFDYTVENVTTAGDFKLTPKATSTSYGGPAITWSVPTGDSSGHVSASWSPSDANRQYHTGWLVGTPSANTNSGTKITISHFMFEKGNKATDWSPAPEDVDAELSNKLHYEVVTTASDFNDYKTTGIYYFKVGSNTNAPVTNHGKLTVNFDVGTPNQIFEPDNLNYYYKRTYSSSAWSA